MFKHSNKNKDFSVQKEMENSTKKSLIYLFTCKKIVNIFD